MNFGDSASESPASFYWGFHRASLHKSLFNRAVELGAAVQCNSRVVDVRTCGNKDRARLLLESAREIEANLAVGTDGINS
jgi:salicylate hydroxylase